MNKSSTLKPEKEKELLQAAKPVVTILLKINKLQKEIREKEQGRKRKKVLPGEIEKLKSELAQKNQELAEMDQEKFQEGINSIRFLFHYNQNLVKYIVKGYAFFSGYIDPEELTAEGISSLT